MTVIRSGFTRIRTTTTKGDRTIGGISFLPGEVL